MENCKVNINNNAKTPIEIRDAIIACFKEAHCHDTEMQDSEINDEYCYETVKSMFIKIGANFNNPTKEDLEKVVKVLAEFSINFRKPEVVEKHKGEIMDMINKL